MTETRDFTDLFRAIDGKDADLFAGHLTDDAAFTYGSQPPIEGRQAIRDYVAGFFEALEGLEHRIVEVHDAGDDVSVVEGQVTYHLGPDRSVTLPFANVLRHHGGQIHSYQVYIDPTPLSG
jgi:limonene-1,2-epoxide hydrolase